MKSTLNTWHTLAAEIADPSFELDAEAFAALLVTYARLQDAGQRFDPMLAALMQCLTRQMIASDDGLDDHGELAGYSESEETPSDAWTFNDGQHVRRKAVRVFAAGIVEDARRELRGVA